MDLQQCPSVSRSTATLLGNTDEHFLLERAQSSMALRPEGRRAEGLC